MDQTKFQHMVGRQVRLHRKALGYSQEQLAELSDVHPTFISKIECGKVSASAYSFYKITQALGIKLTDLFEMLGKEGNLEVENDFVDIIGKIKQMDEVQRGLYLSAIKGMLPK
jgi:transcriptional regulator with XRE-family HTH domain